MGVHWQQTDLYKGIKRQEKETGVSYSQYCYANNSYAQQKNSIWTSIISQIPNLIFGGAQLISGLAMKESDDTGSATDVVSRTQQTRSFNTTRKELELAIKSGNKEEASKLLADLEGLANTKTLESAYNQMKTKVNNMA